MLTHTNDPNRGDHPRSRGENTSDTYREDAPTGSSPLTRGKHTAHTPTGNGAGIIPAHAGKTSLHYTSCAMYRDHPRSRGENKPARLIPRSASGSSPLTRGKRPRGDRRQRREGIIPAHAGKTDGALYFLAAAADHPRSRGENPPVSPPVSPPKGSSPLTRGKRIEQAQSSVTVRDHPRSRGENLTPQPAAPEAVGSSPLTRGKPSASSTGAPLAGIIPAHAGKTCTRNTRTARTRDHPRSRGENTS